MRSDLLEIPSRFVEYFRPERHQLIPHSLFGALTELGELRRDDDPERPRGEGMQ
jgi:hypothetical protein